MIVKVEPYQATINAIENCLNDMGKESYMQSVLKKAIKEVADKGKSDIYTSVKKRYAVKGLKKADIKKTNSTSKNPGVTLTVKGRPLGIKGNYQHRKNSASVGAKAKILRSGTMKEIKKNGGNDAYRAFVATMASGHEAVFQRLPGKYMKKHGPTGMSKGREKIEEKYSLSKSKAAEVVYKKEDMYSKMQEEISFRLLKQMHAVTGG